MLTPDYLDTVADPIIEIFSKLQEEILADIVRRITKTDYLTPTAEWQTMKLQESGMLLRDIQKYIQNTLGLTDAELKELFEQATIENLSGHYTTADIIRLLKRDTTMYQTILSGLEKTNGHLKNMTMTTANAYQQLFIDSLDDAYWKVNSGAFDYNSAIVEATDTMLKKGQTVVEYPSGWRNAVDVAVRRAVLTGINQTQGQVQMDLAEEFDLDYMDVSAHLGARPSHAEWQGKRYCISGKDKDFPKFADATGYGTGEGLCGWNCRHTCFATTKNANFSFSENELEELKNKTVTYNGQTLSYYDATQVQRKYERTCRALRRDLVAIDELPDSPEKQALFERKSANLKAREAQYRDFSHQTGLMTQTERMRVYQYNRELSRKVGKASKEYLDGHKGVKPFKAVPTPKPKVTITKQLSVKDMIAKCTSVDDVENLMKSQGWFLSNNRRNFNDEVSLKGCDIDGAKAIANAYATVLERYPQYKGKFWQFTTDPWGKPMGKGTYAQCYLSVGRVEANAYWYGNFKSLVNSYVHDVDTGWHPQNTTAGSVIVHELGHAVDGYLTKMANQGYIDIGNANTVSSWMRPRIAREVGVKVDDMLWEVSEYATKNAKEFFAECFAEYLESPNPRRVAMEFGKMLEEIMKGVNW